MKKKVVFFIPTLEAGGAEKNVVNLLSGLTRDKYEIILLVCQKKGQFLKNIPVFVPVFELGSLNSLVVFFRTVAFLKHQKPDLFISNLSRFNIINLLAKVVSQSDSKMIVVEHTQVSLLPLTAKTFSHRTFARLIFPGLARFLYKSADCIIAVSSGVAQDLKKMLKSEITIKVVYNPVIDKNMLMAAKENVDHVWFSKKEVPVVLSVGRLVKAKNHVLLLEAIKLVLEAKRVNLVVLGQGQEEQNLEELASQMGIKDSVNFIGFQENPFKYMARADVFVNSSIREGFGNSIVEAMVLGVPVISTNCSGPAEIIKDAGVLVPLSDARSLADAIVKVLSDDIFRKDIVKKAMLRANDFLVETGVKNYESIFDVLLHE